MLPQLANTYNPTKNYPNFQWLASPKLDGVRGLYFPDRGLISRSQKTRYVGFEPMRYAPASYEQACKSICDNNNLSFLDGELYIPGEKFDVISGIVRDSKKFDVNQKLRVEYRIFAVGSIANPNMTAATMVNLLNQMQSPNGRVLRIAQKPIDNTPIAIQAEAELVKSSGQSDEGIVLRNPSGVYAGVRSSTRASRTNDLLKVKNFVKGMFVVVGFTKGTGKYANSLGNLSIRGIVDGKIINSKVGTGFSDRERIDIWTNQSNYLGKNIEVIYLGSSRSRKFATSDIFPV